MEEQYLPLRIDGLDDDENYNKVYQALQVVKVPRIAIEKARKEEKQEALDYGRAVDRAAKEIQSLIEPIETHLKNERKRIDDLKEEIKQKDLYNQEIAEVWDEAQEANKQFNAHIAEEKRLEELRLEQERKEAELKARQDEIERKEREERIRQEEREKAEREKQEAIERAKRAQQEAEERAKLEKLRAEERIKEEKERLEREAKEKADKEFAEEQARIKAEKKRIAEEEKKAALAPDIEKLKNYLTTIVKIERPKIKDAVMIDKLNEFHNILKNNSRELLNNFNGKQGNLL
jgi:hypothetical protein